VSKWLLTPLHVERLIRNSLKSEKMSDDAVDRNTIDRFLQGNDIRPEKEKILRKFLKAQGVEYDDEDRTKDNIFKALAVLWGIGEGHIKQIETRICGIYRFYALSEEFEDSIVAGAIEIKSSSHRATELQKEHPDSRYSEGWTGYTFMRRSKVFLTMSAGGNFYTPKFYMLNPYFNTSLERDPACDPAIIRLEGIMIKLGKKDAAIFTSGIHMVPDKDAFKKTEIIHLSSSPNFPPSILHTVRGWGRRYNDAHSA